MAPDPARWRIRAEGVLLFGASERPSNQPGVDLDHPMCPELEFCALRDGQFPSFYVKRWNLTVPKGPKLEFWAHRIVPSHPRVVQGPFRGSEKQHPFRKDSPSGRIGRHMRQRRAIMRVWAHFSGFGAAACMECTFFAPLAPFMRKWPLSWPKAPKTSRGLVGFANRTFQVCFLAYLSSD